jgi:hypothetical protein
VRNLPQCRRAVAFKSIFVGLSDQCRRGTPCAIKAIMMLSLIVIAAYGVLIVSAWVAVRRWYLNWGATESEVAGSVVGDDKVVSPNHETTLAVTINAASGDVWPWLVQMGYQRGGLYSYDWLDRLFGYLDCPSAEHVLPPFQTLRVGDAIPLEPAAVIMTRKMLLGIKRRAEALSAASTLQARLAA